MEKVNFKLFSKYIKYGFYCAIVLLSSCSEEELDDPAILESEGMFNSDPCLFGNEGDCSDVLVGGGGSTGGGQGGGTTNFRGRFQYVHRGNTTDRLWSSYSTTGTSSWTGDRPISATARSNKGPGMVFFEDKLYAFYKGEGGAEKVYYLYSDDGVNWEGDVPIGPIETNQAPVALSRLGNIFVYVVSSSGGAYVRSSSNPSNPDSWGIARQVTSMGMPFNEVLDESRVDNLSVSTFNNEIVLSAIVAHRHIKYLIGSNSREFSEAKRIGNFNQIIKSQDGVATTEFKEYFYWFYNAEKTEKLLVTRTQDFESYETFELKVNGTVAKTDSAPRVATDGEKLVVVYEEDNGNRIYYAYSNNGTTWSGNRPAKGETRKGGPAIVYIPE